MVRPRVDFPTGRPTARSVSWPRAVLFSLFLASSAWAAGASPTAAADAEPLIEAIALGLVVSLAFSETLGLATGGMIVPGYVALSLGQPPVAAGRTVLVTLVVALATYGVIRILSRYMLIYGRRRTVIIILVAFALGALVRAMPLNVDEKTSIVLVPIGFIVPGLIADWMERQGLVQTVSSLIMASVIVRLIMIAMGGKAVL
ncbi:MAG: Poly-gamma-glutamate synthase subunit [Planctomycetota bacterium]|nr:MAG: Poly-gamma-glutamate synthase subunit [Planctomycetota bacterium]